MPVGLTLLGAILATIGFFITIYGFVILFTEGRRAKAKPRLGLATGVGPGTLSVWVNWDPSLFNMQIYRLRISHVSPESKLKEGTFTVTFENPQTQPFIQPIEMPKSFREMLERESNERSLLSFEFRTVDEMSLFLNCHLRKAKKIYQGVRTKIPKISQVLPVLPQDVATVFSLDFEELQARKKRMKDLESVAKAKAAKAAAAKPVVAPAAPVKPVAASAPITPSSTPAPVIETKVEAKNETPVAPVPAPKIEDKPGNQKVEASQDKPMPQLKGEVLATPAKSVRDVVSASNKHQPE